MGDGLKRAAAAAKATRKKKPAPAKGKVCKPVKARVQFNDDGSVRMLSHENPSLEPSDRWVRVLIVPAKGYTVTPVGARGEKR